MTEPQRKIEYLIFPVINAYILRKYVMKLRWSLIVYRCINWSLTVPPQKVENYLTLRCAQDLGSDMLFRLLFGIFAGEGAMRAEDASEAAKTAFNVKRLVVYIGWFIYPLGGFLGRLLGAVDDVPLKLIYNVADFANTTVHMLQLCSALADAEIGPVRPRHSCCDCGVKFTVWALSLIHI